MTFGCNREIFFSKVDYTDKQLDCRFQKINTRLNSIHLFTTFLIILLYLTLKYAYMSTEYKHFLNSFLIVNIKNQSTHLVKTSTLIICLFNFHSFNRTAFTVIFSGRTVYYTSDLEIICFITGKPSFSEFERIRANSTYFNIIILLSF